MPRPTIVEQIAKAAAEGNLEKVKVLSEKLAKQSKQTKSKIKPKSKTKTNPVKNIKRDRKPIDDIDNINDIPELDLEVNEDDEDDIVDEEQNNPSHSSNPKLKDKDGSGSDFLAPARNPNRQKPKKYLDEDGIERTTARIVPFEIIKNRQNKWKDNKNVAKEDIKIYQKVKKRGYQPVERDREPVNKVKVKCFRCKEYKVVWPGEVTHKRWSCDECLTSSARGRREN